MGLVYLCFAWVAGIYLGARFDLSLFVLLVLLIPALLLLLFWRRKRALLWCGLCLIVFCGGVLRLTLAAPDQSSLQLYNEQGTVEMRGMVEEEPESREGAASLRLAVEEIEAQGEWQQVSGSVLIFTTRFPAYEYGDQLQVKGELHTPPQFDGFDYRAYLAQQGIFSTMLYPEIELVSTGQGSKPMEWLLDVRGRLSQSLTSALHEPQASLTQALLLGIRSHIPDQLMSDFRATGTAHLLAISGLHVAVLGGMVLIAAAWLFGKHRPVYVLVTLAAIWGYALLSGMHPPAFRAAIMFSFLPLALWLGRPNSVITSLFFAAAVMVGISPQILGEVSFQLSFAAVAGIVLLFPRFQSLGRKAVARIPASAVNPIVDALAVSLAAVLATFPLIAYHFGYISFVGLPATFLALPALPGVIVTAFFVGVLGLFAPPLAQVVGWVTWLFISYMLAVVRGFAALSFASREVGPVAGIWVWVYYGALILTVWIVTARKRLGMSLSRVIVWGQKK